MLIDGINLVEGSKITNLTVAAGTSFPANPNAGELFYRTDTTTLYVHNGTTWDTVGSGGSGTPGGNNTEVQFNDSGTFAGDAQLTWNKTTNVLSIDGNAVWHAGNDGASSGLDADTLDGQQATAFASSTHNHSGTYQPVDADLTAIAGLSGTSGILTKTAADTWTLDTNTYSTTSHNHDSTYVNVSGDTMTGVLQLPAGSSSAPSLNFGDTSTGFYKYGTNEIGVTLNGVRHTRFMSAALMPFTETSSFQVRPTVYSDSNFFGAFDGYSYGGTISSPAAVASGRGLARLGGAGYDGTTVSRAAEITMTTGGAWSGTSRPTYISFLTTPVNGTASSERMRITPDGGVGLGTTSITGYRLAVGGTVTGSTTGVGNYVYASVGNDVTHAYGFRCGMPVPSGTAATQLHYFRAQQDTFTGTVASQYGFSVSSNLTGATNNYAFNGELAAAANTYNLHMSGTANNYLNGSVGIGTTALTGMTLRLGKALTGAADVYSVISSGAIQSDATSSARIFTSQVYTQAASFTCPHVYHYIADQGALGAGSAITNQYGFAVGTTLTGATNNYGFYGSIAAGTGRWNLYMGGTAINYLNGTLLIGTTTDNGTDKLQVSGTAVVTAPDSTANNTQVPTTAWVRTYASGAYQPVDADLTAIAGLSGTSGILTKTAADTWTLDTNSYSTTSHDHSGTYQPVDADLTAIAGLSGTSGFLKKTAADTWTLDTNTYSTTSHDHSGTYQPLDGQLTDIASLSPTKGNLIVGDGTNFISIGVGTNDYVLTADSAQTAGVKWAAGGSSATGDTSATPNTLAQRDASADLYAANFVSTSDERLKENVRPIENALNKVMQLDGKMFNFIGSDKTQLGLIAQEVEKVVPEVVNTNDEGYKSVNYPVLVALLVEAIKELARR